MNHIFFIHFSADGHLGYLHDLAIVNSAAVNTRVHISFQIMVFSGYMPRVGIAESYGSSVKKLHTALHSSCTNLHFCQQCTGDLFPKTSSTFVICVLFDDSHSDRCAIIFHYGFNLHFSDD